MRFWEIDTIRGIAVVLMVIFNWSFALSYFAVYTIDGGTLFWFWFPRILGAMFIFIAGVSFSVSYSKLRDKRKSWVYRKYFLRGAKILGLGLLITLVTWIFVPRAAILFGILHLIGISIMLAPLFRNYGKLNMTLGILFIAIGVYFQSLTVTSSWLLWLGLKPENFYTFDYFPIFPWFGIVLLGIFAGGGLYAKGKRRFDIGEKPGVAGILSFLGRHSLVIYLIHQPILIAVLYALGFTLF